MPGPLTVDDMVEAVRSQLDEANTDRLGDDKIVAMLNRGQRRAASLLSKDANDLMLDYKSVSLTAGTDTYDTPLEAYGRRVTHITVVRNSIEYPVRRVTYRQLYKFSVNQQVFVPTVYALKGKSYIVKPTPSNGVVLRVWYTKAPETLVKSEGRITNVGTNYLVVDAIGDALTTTTSDLSAFFNVVDAATGTIKVTLQASALATSTKTVTFKTTGLTYGTIYNRTVATALPTSAPTVAVNDYLCPVQGTCVPDLWDEIIDYIIQYAVVEGKQKLGETTQDAQQLLNTLEGDVKSQWAGREAGGRIVNRSRSWTR